MYRSEDLNSRMKSATFHQCKGKIEQYESDSFLTNLECTLSTVLVNSTVVGHQTILQ